MTLVARSGETTIAALESGPPAEEVEPVTPEALTRLAESASAGRRWRAARNPGTPPEVLARLAGDEDSAVRRSVAENPETPPEALAWLAGDDRALVRRGASRNPRTPPEALADLAGDEDYLTRRRVAQNAATPEDALSLLARDSSDAVREAADREQLRRRLRRALEESGAAALYAALGEDPLQWSEERQRQLLRELGEDA